MLYICFLFFMFDLNLIDNSLSLFSLIIFLSENLKTIYLNDFYNLQGAKLAAFSGYSMPINFSKGIIKEHLHTNFLRPQKKLKFH